MPATNFLMVLAPDRILSRNQPFAAPFINYQTGRYIGNISITADRIEADKDGIVTIIPKSLNDVLPLSYAIRSCWDLGHGPIKFNVNSQPLIVTLEDEQQFVLMVERILNSRSN